LLREPTVFLQATLLDFGKLTLKWFVDKFNNSESESPALAEPRKSIFQKPKRIMKLDIL